MALAYGTAPSHMDIHRKACYFGNKVGMCCFGSYSMVGGIEHRYVVTLGVRGTMNKHPRVEIDFTGIVHQ